MYVVLRVVNSDFDNAQVMALCSDMDIALNHTEYLISNDVGSDDAMYVVDYCLDE